MKCDDRPSNEVLLDEVIAWCKLRKPGRFRDWELDEFINETWVAARKLVDDKYDPSKSSLTTFLQRFMWDIIHRIYCKQSQIAIERRRYDEEGNRLPGYAPREYRPMFPACAEWEQVPHASSDVYDDLYSIDLSECADLNSRQHDIIQMISRGMTNTQIGYSFNRSPSWVTLELRKIKDILMNQA